MENKDLLSNYYTIGHLVQFTGLTDRTVRNYISAGILTGEKINGLWCFTPEQVDRFLANPAVRPSVLAKKHSLVYDFLDWNTAQTDQTCMILDFPGEDREKLSEYFCRVMCQEDARGLKFSYDGLGSAPRVILKGDTQKALRLVNGWYAEK